MNLFLILLTFGALEWTETTFEDFRDGSVDPMCYVSHRAQYETFKGCVEFYARWDADNDGYYDLFVAGKDSYGQKLFMGSATGYDLSNTISFTDWTRDGGGIDMADLNLDGYAEAIHSGGWYAPSIYIYWGTPTGPDPTSLTTLNTPNSNQCHETVFTYDINKDGYLDLTTCGGGSGPNYTRIFWGAEGNPITYSTANHTDLPTGIGSQHNLEMADLDHDGWVDVVISNWSSSTASIIHFEDGGTYTIETLDLSPLSGSLHGTTLADLDGNEWLDIVFTGYNNISDALIYWGGPEGYDHDSTTVLTPGPCYGGSSSMDLDHDGLLDLVFHKNGGSSTYPVVYFNTDEPPYFWESDSTMENLGNIPVNGTGGFTADFDFDGDLDIFLNAHQSGDPWTTQSPILWGPDYTTLDYLDHDGYDHHGVFREAGNVYDRTFTAWYYSNVFDTDPYNFSKNAKFSYIGYEPEGTYITFSMRSGPDSIVNNSWTKWYQVQNGYAHPSSLQWQYVQYRAEFHYSRPCWLPWLEQVQIKFYPLDYALELYPDSLKTVSTGEYVEYPLILYYKGDEDDSFYLDLRSPPFQEDWRIELWDTAYIDTIAWHIKLREVIPQGVDSPFVARIYPSVDAQPGDTNVTLIWTRTRRCTKTMEDSVVLYTVVTGDGTLEGWIEQPASLKSLTINTEGWVDFSVPYAETGRLIVFDATGRKVYANDVTGTGRLKWSDVDMPRGLYFVRLEMPEETLVRKVILTR